MKRIVFAMILAAALLFMGLYTVVIKCKQLFSKREEKGSGKYQKDPDQTGGNYEHIA